MRIKSVVTRFLPLLAGGLLLFGYQNCAPVGETFEKSSSSEAGNDTAGTTIPDNNTDPTVPPPPPPPPPPVPTPTPVETVCPSNSRPRITTTTFSTLTVFAGYGATDAGDSAPQNVNVPFTDANAGQNHECLVSVSGNTNRQIDTPTCTVNTGSLRVSLEPGDPCRQGNVTVSVRVRDVCSLDSNELTSNETAVINLVVISSCLTEDLEAANPPVHGSNYGSDAALDGAWAAIASSRDSSDDGFLSLHGSVHIYQRSNTTLTFSQRVVPSDVAAGAADESRRNGGTVSSVDLSGDHLVMGAPRSGNNDGAVYAFRRQTNNSWTQVQRILPPAGATRAYFGQSVAVSGNRMVIGAPEAASGGVGRGAAYVYNWSGSSWVLANTLTAGAGAIDYEQFGFDVEIDNGNIIIGAPMNPLHRTNARGGAYFYSSANYTSGTKLTTTTVNVGAQLGYSVGISGTRIVVGAPGHKTNPLDSAQDDAGKAFLFQTSNLSSAIEFPGEAGRFGASVSIDGQKILIGAPYHTSERGAAFMYDLAIHPAPTASMRRFQLSGARTSDQFGYAVVVDGNHGIVGAPLVNGTSTTDSGNAKLFELISTNY